MRLTNRGADLQQRVIDRPGLVKRPSVVLSPDMYASEALNVVMTTRRDEATTAYLYVANGNKLHGMLPVHKLVYPHPPETTVGSLMETTPATLADSATVAQACRRFNDCRLRALPIVNQSNEIVGVIDVMELFPEHSPSNYDHAFQLAGIHIDEIRNSGVRTAYMDRMPWLLCVITGGLACAGVAAQFENLLREIVLLALFLPLVLALSESVSIQSLTLTLRSIQLNGNIRKIKFRHRLLKEWFVGLLLGITCAAIVASVGVLWKGFALAVLAIALSVCFGAMVSSVLGLCVPTLIHRLNRDPQVAAGPVTLTVADVSTLLFYLGVSYFMLL